MEASAVRLIVGLVVFLVVGSEAMNYLAFPRMGRSGYLAFPRMGRSGGQTEESEECCNVGLKNEWAIGEDGKTEVRTICPSSVCCEGLREEVSRKPDDGSFYSMCLPESCKTQTVTDRKLASLKQLLAH